MLVADASASLSWFLESPLSTGATRTFNFAKSSLLIVPPIWIYETQNALLKLTRQRRISQDEAHQIRIEFDLIYKRIDRTNDPDMIDRTLEIAKAHMMTFYDASYVELAFRLGLPLATGDQAEKNAAKALGIKPV